MDSVTIHAAEVTRSPLRARGAAGEDIIVARGDGPVANPVPVHPSAFLAAGVEAVATGNGLLRRPVPVRHGEVAGALPGPQKDPLDRMLIARAMVEDPVKLSSEALFGCCGVKRLWQVGQRALPFPPFGKLNTARHKRRGTSPWTKTLRKSACAPAAGSTIPPIPR